MENSSEKPVENQLHISLDPEKAAEVLNSCVTLFTQLLQDEDEDRALGNIASASFLVFDSFRTDTPLACGKGCSYCCYQPVGITLAEARTIALFIPSLPEDLRKDSLKRLKRQKNLTPAKYGTNTVNKKYPCPFLHEDGSCRIYDVRPLTCRRYTSTSVEVCKAKLEGDTTQKVSLIPAYYIVQDTLAHATEIALKNHADIGRNVSREYEMISAVSYIIKDRGIS